MVGKFPAIVSTLLRRLMKQDRKPVVNLSLHVEIELEYDSFKGRTIEHIADNIADDVNDFLMDSNSDILGVFTTITSTKELETTH
jgi:hypothetical protein